MPGEKAPNHAPVEWAQRKDLIYVTIRMEDANCSTMDITEEKLHIVGTGGPDKAPFVCDIEFYKPIDNAKVRREACDRSIEFIIPKKENGPFWPRLLKTSSKQHWLKVDFNKWKDEDDESEPENAWNMDDMMGRMGGLGGGKPDLDDFDEDSDNAELPDLEDDKDEDETTMKSGDQQKKTDEGLENGKANVEAS